MSRFDPSMSWDQQKSFSDSDPFDSDSSVGEKWDGQDSFSQSDSPLDSTTWGHFGHRNYFLPLHYEPNYQYPLIVWLHSNGFNENQVDHVMPHISVRNYVATGVRGIRAADSVGHRFDWHESPASVAAAEDAVASAVEEATEQFSVHPERIVLAGYRTGGTMALRLAMRHPERFAAAISMGGAMPSRHHILSNLAALRERRLPMLWQWGTEGNHFHSESLKADIRQAMMIRASVEVRQYVTDDEMDTVALSDLNEWIMRTVVSNSSAVAEQRWASSPTAYSAN